MRFREEAASLDSAILRVRCPRTLAGSAAAMVSAAADPMLDVLVNLAIDRPTLAVRDSRVIGPPTSADPVSPAIAQQISADPVNRAIALETLADPVSPVIARATSVDPDVLVVTTYKISRAELLTGANGRIGARRIWATLGTIGKTIGEILVIGTATVGGTTITSIIRTIQDSVSGQVPRGRDSLTGSIMAGLILSTTTTAKMFTTKMARCITAISRCARKRSTCNKPRRSH